MNGDAANTPAHSPIDMSTQNGSVSLPNTMCGGPSLRSASLSFHTRNIGAFSHL